MCSDATDLSGNSWIIGQILHLHMCIITREKHHVNAINCIQLNHNKTHTPHHVCEESRPPTSGVTTFHQLQVAPLPPPHNNPQGATLLMPTSQRRCRGQVPCVPWSYVLHSCFTCVPRLPFSLGSYLLLFSVSLVKFLSVLNITHFPNKPCAILQTVDISKDI